LATLLAQFQPDPKSTQAAAIQKALFLASHLQQRVLALQTPAERRQQAEMDRMLQHPEDKATLAMLTDQAFRPQTPRRVVDQFIHILKSQGIPRFFHPLQQAMLKGFQTFGGLAPWIAVPAAKAQMRRQTAAVILPAEPDSLLPHLRARHAEGVRMNVNFLGEAILGEKEARRRLLLNLQGLQSPEVEVISIKISTIYSQISALARDHTVAVLCDRLELLYRTAAHLTFTRPDGGTAPKFVYLDMEEYRDMDLTAEAFMRTLERPGLEKVAAGIVLQAYVPDSFGYQKRLCQWARGRVSAGGAPVTLRIVKGANMESERCEASQKGWPQAPYMTKLETDGNFHRMVREAMKPENIAAVHVGIASHNLFDLAFALGLAADSGVLDRVQFEMLEGMANPQRRALFELTRNLLLYAPVCHKEDFINAIGYLIRRLDENTGPENFLRYAFRITSGSPEWQRLEEKFVAAAAAAEKVSASPRRTQNRQLPPPAAAVARGWQHLENEPDTDFSLPHNSDWAKHLVAAWAPRQGSAAAEIPLVIAGEEIRDGRTVRECLDPSRPGVIVGRYRQATAEDVDRAVACAAADPAGWRKLDPAARFERLGRVADELRRARADLMGAAVADGGKTLPESDPEVSEAIDFVEFYRANARWWQEMPSLRARPKGVVAVVSPWNFPIAIPCGGVAAALAAGNTVILKPASDAVLVAWELCRCFWRSGVSRSTLQFLPCSGGREGQRLVNHRGVDAVILTGGTETALAMLRDKPSMNLTAETGGKNAIVVTAMSDRDQAVKHVIHSAFSHAGQKCSATSLLLLEAEVYDDPKFKHALCDAVESMTVGSAWDLKTKIGPLIRPPSGDLDNALKVLDRGESWAVLPRRLENNPNLWSPGVKYGVRPGSTTHVTEFFGPLLGVMRFDTLAEAINLVNQTGYGLTSGLQSLDDREQRQWLAGIRAGNLYINRTTVGAVVLRQPFGGMGRSAFGPGIKAGGPNYVAEFMDLADSEAATGKNAAAERPGDPRLAELFDQLRGYGEGQSPLPVEDLNRLLAALGSQARNYREEFGQQHDHFRLVGQDNFRRYLPVGELRVRIHPADTAFEVLARVCAARTAGCHITISTPPGYQSPVLEFLRALVVPWAGAAEFVEETDDALAAVVGNRRTGRVRFAGSDRVPAVVQQAAGASGGYLAAQPVLVEGRVELLWYVQEQSISFDYHRYGNLGPRSGEERGAVL
jgi:RHH-type proline utilization regulon transcriptional repressor/proline dehydrogenase/delta 1-pyrroline-5-carboxylate dehydrogenase